MELSMKTIKIFAALFTGMALFSSCENVIDPPKTGKNLDRLVVDAFVNNLPEKQVIRITQSIGYFSAIGSEPGVTGAGVLLIDTTDGNLKTFTFSDSGEGKYIFQPNPATGDTFTIGHNYILAIAQGGDTFISASRLNPTAKIDSLHIDYQDGTQLGFKKGKYVEMFANDLPGLGNTYWIKTYRNDSFKNKILDMNLAYDMTQTPNKQDAGPFIWPIRYGAINDLGRPYKSGETVKVEIFSITLETYYYLNEIYSESQNGGLFATPPINIGTNIFNLNPKKTRATGGFFCISAVNRKQIIIP